MKRTLLSGNEAIACDAWEAGAKIGVGYPPAPSTEISQNPSRLAPSDSTEVIETVKLECRVPPRKHRGEPGPCSIRVVGRVRVRGSV